MLCHANSGGMELGSNHLIFIGRAVRFKKKKIRIKFLWKIILRTCTLCIV